MHGPGAAWGSGEQVQLRGLSITVCSPVPLSSTYWVRNHLCRVLRVHSSNCFEDTTVKEDDALALKFGGPKLSKVCPTSGEGWRYRAVAGRI